MSAMPAQERPMPYRQLQAFRISYATIGALGTLVVVLLALCGVLIWFVQTDADNRHGRQEVATMRADFKESLSETKGVVNALKDALVEVMKSEAGLHSDIINMKDRIDILERNRHP